MRCSHELRVSLRAWRFLSVMVAALFGAAALVQAAPTINNVSTRGLTIGAASSLVLDGAEFDANLKIVSTLPIAEQKVQLEGSNNRAKIELKVADQAAPGIYSLRVANAGGVSNAVLIAVDRLPNQPLAPQTTALPVALQGSLTGESRVRTTVAAKKGQLFLAEVECQRLASSFRPVLRLFDARGVQVAWAAPSNALGGDSRLVASIPADGEYAVEVHDVLFAPQAPVTSDSSLASSVTPTLLSRAVRRSVN